MAYTLECNGVYLLDWRGEPKQFSTWEAARAADYTFSGYNGRIHKVQATAITG